MPKGLNYLTSLSVLFWVNTASLPKHYQRSFLGDYGRSAKVRNEDNFTKTECPKVASHKTLIISKLGLLLYFYFPNITRLSPSETRCNGAFVAPIACSVNY